MGVTPNILSSVLPPPISAWGPVQPPLQPAANNTPRHDHPINLVDPITRKELNLHDPFKDRLLRLNPWERFKLGLRNTFITLPQNIYQGLKGDPNYSFADFLNISKAPYYLGGAFLAASFAAGRAKLNFTRQSIGVALYFLGVMGANRLIDALYKSRSGVDLNLRYHKASTGDIEKALSSADFPRFDLLEDADYERMAKKMKIPEGIADRNREVHEQLRQIISTARADKLILGNLLAAFGAGYIAQTDAWARLQGPYTGTRLALAEGSLFTRAKNAALSLWGHAERGVQEQLTGFAEEQTHRQRVGFLGGMIGLTLLTMAHIWWSTRKKQYEVALPNAQSGLKAATLNEPPVSNPFFAHFAPSAGGLGL